jgi:uncharacterized membrane protein YsdA (DUF1294 family)
MATRRRRPKLWWSVLGLTLSLGLAAGLALGGILPPGWAWLVACSLVTLAWYGLDKLSAGQGWSRIPELTLHLLALAGGSPGALAGMSLFRHKTAKGSFRIVLAGILILQIALVIALPRWLAA